MAMLTKRAQMLYLSMLDTIKSEKEYGRGGCKLFKNDIDKELSKKDVFKNIAEGGNYER